MKRCNRKHRTKNMNQGAKNAIQCSMFFVLFYPILTIPNYSGNIQLRLIKIV